MNKHFANGVWSMLRSPARLAGRSWTSELLFRVVRGLFQSAQGKPIEQLRRSLEKSAFYHPVSAKCSVVQREIAGVPCVMVGPKSGAKSNIVMVYCHGGGYVVGSPKTHHSILAEIAYRADALVVAPDYRLAPEHPFPAPQDDCLSVVTAVLNAYPDHAVIVAGDSAGGGLAIDSSLCLAQQADARLPDALVLISPWVEPSADSGSIQTNQPYDYLAPQFLQQSINALMSNGDTQHSRIDFSQANLASLPPTLIQYGSGEVFADQIEQFAKRAEAAGVDVTLQNYPAQFHVFQLMSLLLADAKHALQAVADFMAAIKAPQHGEPPQANQE